MHAQPSSGARRLDFCWTLHLLPYLCERTSYVISTKTSRAGSFKSSCFKTGSLKHQCNMYPLLLNDGKSIFILQLITTQTIKTKTVKLNLPAGCKIWRKPSLLIYIPTLQWPSFSTRQLWSSSVDPDQTILSATICSGSTLDAIQSASFRCITLDMVKPHSSNFRTGTANLFGCHYRTYHEYVVPRSIPMTVPTDSFFFFSPSASSALTTAANNNTAQHKGMYRLIPGEVK